MRVRGHFEGDAQKYRPTEELADLIHSDPLRRARKALLDAGSSEAEIDLVDARVKRRVLESVEQARKGSEPDFETALLGVYSNGRAL